MRYSFCSVLRKLRSHSIRGTANWGRGAELKPVRVLHVLRSVPGLGSAEGNPGASVGMPHTQGAPCKGLSPSNQGALRTITAASSRSALGDALPYPVRPCKGLSLGTP